MSFALTGRARRLGDDINTDYIISSARKRETIDESILKRYLLETVDPAFAGSVLAGDILVAGRNFGCGSAMEIAATVIRAAGIRAVLAHSFARTFYRNAMNNGLPAIECDTISIAEGAGVRVQIDGDVARVTDVSTGIVVTGIAPPPIMLEILESGGLVEYVRAHGGFQSHSPPARR